MVPERRALSAGMWVRPSLFWVMWGVGLVLALALSSAASASAYFPGDLRLAVAIQAAGFPLALADFFNTIAAGVPAFVVVLVVIAVFVGVHRRDLAVPMVVGAMAALAPVPMKLIVGRPRPLPDLVHVVAMLQDLSFPSGHAMYAMLSYGLLAVLLEATTMPLLARRPLQVGCALVVVLVGVSRIVVGAHWPSDVLGGYVWGGLIASALVRLAGPANARESAAADGAAAR